MAMYPVMGYGAPHPNAQQQTVPDTRNGYQEYGVFSESNGIADPIGAIAFDPVEELVWSGSQTVRALYHLFIASMKPIAAIGDGKGPNAGNPSAKRKRTSCEVQCISNLLCSS